MGWPKWKNPSLTPTSEDRSPAGDEAAARVEELVARIDHLESVWGERALQLSAAQELQQHAMEGMQAWFNARLDRLEEEQLTGAMQTFTGLVLAAMYDHDLPAANPAPLVKAPEYTIAHTNRRILSALEWQADRRAILRDAAGVLEVSRAAADWSSTHHPGTFVSTRVERALALVGRALVGNLPIWRPSGDRTRVLHVLTLASAIGGHTRLAERWMRFHPEANHALVLTEGSTDDLPDSIRAASTLGVHTLEQASAIERIVELNQLAAQHDVVVLHIHAFDALTVAALADARRRPPTILVNHADHIFWLGVAAADVIVSTRPSGAELVAQRRGVGRNRSVTVPLPVETNGRLMSRSSAKREIGLDDSRIVLLTMASAYKYAPIGSRSFTSLISKVLEADERTILVAVGPDKLREDWQQLCRRFPERVQIPGPMLDPRLVLDAADVYLDSFPFSSATSLYEASLHETAAVVLAPPGAHVLALDDRDVRLLRCPDESEWIAAVLALVRDAERRHAEGMQLAMQVANAHGKERVGSIIESVTKRVRRGRARPPHPAPSRFEELDRRLIELQLASNIGRSVADLLIEYDLLPPDTA